MDPSGLWRCLRERRRVLLLLAAVGLALLLTPAVLMANGAPTVNGRFYGDGDDGRYISLGGSSSGRGDLYSYLDGTTLYAAVVLSPAVNDNVFGDLSVSGDKTYVQSAGWSGEGNKHTAFHLIKSDYVEMILSCGGNSWTWRQDYAQDADKDADPNEPDWFSDHTGDDGLGTPPPGTVSSSSFEWNMEGATCSGCIGPSETWKSPDDGPMVNDVADEGYATYDTSTDWEWRVVYEMSFDVSSCGSDPISVWALTSHNSPPKGGSGYVEFFPTDYGDAPDPTYPTLKVSNGAVHTITVGGPRLGALVDGESDGQAEPSALGDDNDGSDDEDGVVIPTLTPGTQGSVQVTGTAGAKLDAWIDFSNDGDWSDPGEQIATSYTLAGGGEAVTFPVPTGAGSGSTFARFRISTAGGLAPTGPADDGEVEDYQLTIGEEPEEPDIDIEKAANGVDADNPTGPYVGVGGTVTWTYVVENTGALTLTNVTLTDDQLADDTVIDCGEGKDNVIADLAPDEIVTCEATGTATAGQYGNEATVAGDYDGMQVTDSDPSHYFGSEGGIAIEKATNGQDADAPTGPTILVGGTVTWTYAVSLTTQTPLIDVVVTDDNGTPIDAGDDFSPTYTGGDTNGNGWLDPGELWTYEAFGVAVAGQYENFAAVIGYDDEGGNPYSDNDPSHYFGADPDIDIEKRTNTKDADTPTGPRIAEHLQVTWDYLVTNPGNVPVAQVTVVDDNGTPGDTGDDFSPVPVLSGGFNVGDVNRDGLLDTDETWLYQVTGAAELGQYGNVATVAGAAELGQWGNVATMAGDYDGIEVTDSDPSHYLGVVAEVGGVTVPPRTVARLAPWMALGVLVGLLMLGVAAVVLRASRRR